MHRLGSVLLGATLLVVGSSSPWAQPAPGGVANRPPPMVISSTGFEDGGVLPNQFSGLAANPVSPPLSWLNPPAGTMSYVLQVRDMEPLRDRDFVDVIHWFAFNIPGTALSLAQGVPAIATLPDGTVQLANFSGRPGFIAPGAPPGAYHHYIVELFALDVALPLSATSGREQVLAAMSGHLLGKAVTVFRFHR